MIMVEFNFSQWLQGQIGHTVIGQLLILRQKGMTPPGLYKMMLNQNQDVCVWCNLSPRDMHVVAKLGWSWTLMILLSNPFHNDEELDHV